MTRLLLFKAIISFLTTCFITLFQIESVSTIGTTSAKEWQSLFDLYNSTNGNKWNIYSGFQWNFSNPLFPCRGPQWAGINCTCPLNSLQNSCNITSLSLGSFNLEGTLPSSLGNLVNLKYLNLTNSNISGRLPSSLGNLFALQYLYLYYNNISGTLPPSLGNLVILRYLYLYNNSISGSLPSSLGNLVKLRYLVLFNNSINGTFPSSLGNLVKLQYLVLYDNKISGTLPSSFGNLVSLKSLSLSKNYISGTLPSSFGNLVNLRYLVLFNNYINGSLPSSLGNLVNLSELILDSNNISGTLSSSLGNLVNLTELYLNNNKIFGTLPSSLGNLVNLQYLELYYNNISGTLPSSLGNLVKLQELILSNNSINGTLPSSLGNLVKLRYLVLSNNSLSGSLLSSFENLINLEGLVLFNNYISGTLPSSFGNLVNLQGLLLSNNQISGTIPSFLGNLTMLYELDLYYNTFTGEIPFFISSRCFNIIKLGFNYFRGSIPLFNSTCHSLTALGLNNNLLTGSIPSSIIDNNFNIETASYLNLDNNILSGTIPTIGVNKYLTSISFSSNLLTGTIPTSIIRNVNIQQVLLQNNNLVGLLSDLLNDSVAVLKSSLVNFQINNNHLTGSLPYQLFQLPKIQTMSLGSNCLYGTIPLTICNNNSNLNALVMDGLQSSPKCQVLLLTSFTSSAYVLKNPKNGPIPSCIFNLLHLTTLHLSGNGYTGKLSSDVAINFKLNDLSLSHNSLSGEIPLFIQTRNWNQLDLSYNRFRGELSSNFSCQSNNCSLYLEDNRLSGNIPSSIQSLQTINVLESNLFFCDILKSSLPSNDPNKYKYECASNSFDIPYYLWLGLILLLSIIIIYSLYMNNDYCLVMPSQSILLVMSKLKEWKKCCEECDESNDKKHLYFIGKMSQNFSRLRLISSIITLYCLLILMPIYAVTGIYYGTYKFKYMWVVSAGFNSGYTATIIYLVFMTFVIILIFVLFQIVFKKSSSMHKNISTAAVRRSLVSLRKYFLIESIIFMVIPLMNIVIVGGVNVLYVYIVLTQSHTLLALTQISLAIFKIFWNDVFYQLMNRWAVKIFKIAESDLSFVYFSLQIAVGLFNNITIPCIIIAIIDSNCFYHVFVQADNVTSTVQVNNFLIQLYFSPYINGYSFIVTQALQPLQTSYSPPFTYSYQCSASFITYYAPAFLYQCILVSLIIPILQMGLVALNNKNSILPNYLHIYICKLCPRILLVPQSDSEDNNKKDNKEYDELYPYVDGNQLIVTMFTYLGLLLTFGVVFPPLAAALLVSIYSNTLFTQLTVGRFIKITTDRFGENNKYIDIINKECRLFCQNTLIKQSVWILITISCCFYALFVFDTLGNEVGVEGAYWTIIVMGLLPLLLYIGFKFWMRLSGGQLSDYNNNNNNNNDNDDDDKSIELVEIGQRESVRVIMIGDDNNNNSNNHNISSNNTDCSEVSESIEVITIGGNNNENYNNNNNNSVNINLDPRESLQIITIEENNDNKKVNFIEIINPIITK